MTIVVERMFVLWDFMPCGVLCLSRRVKGTCCLHFQGDWTGSGGSYSDWPNSFIPKHIASARTNSVILMMEAIHFSETCRNIHIAVIKYLPWILCFILVSCWYKVRFRWFGFWGLRIFKREGLYRPHFHSIGILWIGLTSSSRGFSEICCSKPALWIQQWFTWRIYTSLWRWMFSLKCRVPAHSAEWHRGRRYRWRWARVVVRRWAWRRPPIQRRCQWQSWRRWFPRWTWTFRFTCWHLKKNEENIFLIRCTWFK